MFKIIWLLVNKEVRETLSSKRKLWPFVFALLPMFMFFYTKGSESMFSAGASVFIVPVLITSIIAMQLSSTSILNEKNTKMLDIMLAMKIKPIIIVLAKNIFVTSFSMIIGFIIVLTMKFGSIYVFHEDLLMINFSYLILFITITYFSSVVTFLVSLIINEISVIPIISTLILILVTGSVYKFLVLNGIILFSNNTIFIISTFLILLNIIITVINACILLKSKFIMSI